MCIYYVCFVCSVYAVCYDSKMKFQKISRKNMDYITACFLFES